MNTHDMAASILIDLIDNHLKSLNPILDNVTAGYLEEHQVRQKDALLFAINFLEKFKKELEDIPGE